MPDTPSSVSCSDDTESSGFTWRDKKSLQKHCDVYAEIVSVLYSCPSEATVSHAAS